MCGSVGCTDPATGKVVGGWIYMDRVSFSYLVSLFDNVIDLEFYISSRNVICGSHVLMP